MLRVAGDEDSDAMGWVKLGCCIIDVERVVALVDAKVMHVDRDLQREKNNDQSSQSDTCWTVNTCMCSEEEMKTNIKQYINVIQHMLDRLDGQKERV